MADKRTNRDQESREQETRESFEWVNPSQLPVPNKKPGYDYRWIRISTLGQPDVRNVSKAFRQGWVPAKAQDYPELGMGSDDDRFPDGVENGGLLLCVIAEEILEKKKAHYREKNAQISETVDHGFMNDRTDPRMRKFNESSSRNEFGRG